MQSLLFYFLQKHKINHQFLFYYILLLQITIHLLHMYHDLYYNLSLKKDIMMHNQILISFNLYKYRFWDLKLLHLNINQLFIYLFIFINLLLNNLVIMFLLIPMNIFLYLILYEIYMIMVLNKHLPFKFLY